MDTPLSLRAPPPQPATRWSQARRPRPPCSPAFRPRTVTGATAGGRPASLPCCQSKRRCPGDDPTSSGADPGFRQGARRRAAVRQQRGPGLGLGGRPRWRRAARRAALAPAPPWGIVRKSSRSSAPARASTSCSLATAPPADRVRLPPRPRHRPSRRNLSPALPLPRAPAPRAPLRPLRLQAPGPGPRCLLCA